MKKTFVWIAMLAFAGAQANAATITWGTAQDINIGATGGTDVSTQGSLVAALNVGDTNNSPTVNGVVFAADDGSSSINPAGNAYDFANPGDFADADYDVLLHRAVSYTQSITLNSLTSGQEYLVQVWGNDSRNLGTTDRHYTLDGAGDIYVSAAGTDAVGQTIIGTFVADATSQTITLAGYNGTADMADAVVVNAVQVRAIPEPATLGLIGMSATLVIFIRRQLMI